MEHGSSNHLFKGTAQYYSRFRFGYPADLIDFVVTSFQLGHSTTVLDLGCGTGQLAIPIAARGVPVHAVDPEIEMLAEGLRVEQTAGPVGVAWRLGDDRALAQMIFPELHLCIMGASFHWMDRDEVIAVLDNKIGSFGGVAVVDAVGGKWSGGNEGWGDVTSQVVEEFLGPRRRAGSGYYKPPKVRHEVVLRRSAFSVVSAFFFTSNLSVGIDGIIGLQLSTSCANSGLLGVRVEAFKARLKERLENICPEGVFTGSIRYQVLTAFRPTNIAQ